RADFWIETNTEDLTKIDLIIGSGSSGEGIILRYNFDTDQFAKLNDPTRYLHFDDQICAMMLDTTDPDHSGTIIFKYDFDFSWYRSDLVSIEMRIEGTGVRGTTIKLPDMFRVVTQVQMEGNITVYDVKDRELDKGGYVKGGDYLTFTGVTRTYADPEVTIAPPDMISIAIRDRTGKLYTQAEPDLMNLRVLVDSNYQDMEYFLEFINVSAKNDLSDPSYQGWRFLVLIDNDNPGLPGEILVKPDSNEDRPRNYDDDRDVFVTWKDAVDQSSGVAMYHITVNMDKEEAYATGAEMIDVTKGTYTAQVEGLSEGINKIFIWAEDNVGNEGNSIFVEVKIDLTQVYFTDFYPVTGEWTNTLRPTCSIMVHDDLTGVDPLSIQYEISTSGEVGLVGDWQTILESYAAGPELRVVVSGWFKNGQDNWIRFRAKDVAGNPFFESEAYNVWIDAMSPTYKLLSHSEDEYHLDALQEVRVQVIDEQSGVIANSIEYRITTQGLTKWSQWMPYKDATDGLRPTVTLREYFRRGDQNYVQVRAVDQADNSISFSKVYNIKINTYPVIDVVSPGAGDELYTDKDIVFDASPSYDPDGDRLTISWYISTIDGHELLGDSAQVLARLEPGEYTVTVIAKDRVNNEVQYHYTITVVEPLIDDDDFGIDTDMDGLPDSWEYLWQTDPETKDALDDPDNDDYTNMQEYENKTNPKNPDSHPSELESAVADSDISFFDQEAWPLWALLAILLIAALITMGIVKSKKDKAVKRIKTVRNMRNIMPSVSWDQITATAYMAPMTQAGVLPAAAGPALAPAQFDQSTALPPAQEAEAAHEAAHVVQQADASTASAEPAPAPAPAEPAPAPAPAEPAPAPAPAPQPMQAAPSGTTPAPEQPPAQNNLPPQ
ncbi:MAG: hypothetical protein U9R75_12595, partial [Candidatus Thermoplasmatota archaeon]|nr:hypothetical protein [Candidatus Thermoplasmatota archaeon]